MRRPIVCVLAAVAMVGGGSGALAMNASNAPAAPPYRDGAAVAYDAAHSQVVLFGGSNGTVLADTWMWDGADWTQRTPAHTPSKRVRAGMATDSAHGLVVLFGGWNHVAFGDTWTWGGSDWTQQTPAHAPSARYDVGIADDAAQGR